MILDYNNIEAEALEHFKGGEKTLLAKMFFDGTNRILHGTLPPGASIGEHKHETNSEILYVLSGEGTIVEDGIPNSLSVGQCTYCEKGHSHSLVNTSNADLVFFAVVPEQ